MTTTQPPHCTLCGMPKPALIHHATANGHDFEGDAMKVHVTPDHLDHLAWVTGADIECDTTNNVAYLRLGPWVYLAPLTPVAVS